MPGLNPYARQPGRSRSTTCGTTTAEVTGVNHYGAKARDHWRKHLPGQPGADPGSGGVLHAAGRDSRDADRPDRGRAAQTEPPGEGYLEELGRLETARKMAEMQVTREMLLVDPEDPEKSLSCWADGLHPGRRR